MSIKTYFKKVAVIAAAALALGGLSAIPASAAYTTTAALTNSSWVATPTGVGSVGTPVAVGSTAYVQLILSNGSGISTVSFDGGLELAWTAVVDGSSVTTPVLSAASGNGATTFTMNKSAGTAKINLTLTSSTAVNHTISVDGTALITVYVVGASTDGVVTPISTTGVTAGATVPSSPMANNAVTITSPVYTFTASNTPRAGSGLPGTFSHDLVATIAGPGAVSSVGFTTESATVTTGTSLSVTSIAEAPTLTGAKLTTLVTGSNTVSGNSTVTVTASNFTFTPASAGVYTVTFSGALLTTLTVTITVAADTTRAIWNLGTGSTVSGAAVTASTVSDADGYQTLGITGTVTLPGQYLVLTQPVSGSSPTNAFAGASCAAGSNNYNELTVSGATFANRTGSAFVVGSLNSGSTLGDSVKIIYCDATTLGDVWVNTPVGGGTVTLSWVAVRTSPVSSDQFRTTLQTITIGLTAPGDLNAVKSTAVINSAVGATFGDTGSSTNKIVAAPAQTLADAGVACTVPAPFCADQEILAPAALAVTGGAASIAGTAKAVIKVNLKDVAGLSLLGTLPSVGASITGPGTLSLSTNDGTPNNDGSTGRLLVAPAGVAAADLPGNTTSPFAAGSSTFYINVFSDGTAGTAEISIWVNGSVWKKKTISFYGAPTSLVASQNHKVLKAGATTGSLCYGAAANTLNCDQLTVRGSYAIQVVAKDAAGIAVPYVSYTAVPDKTIITASAKTTAGDYYADLAGATWFDVSTSPNAVSGNTGSVSYTTTLADGTTKLASNSLTFAIGGAPVAVTMGLASGASTEVGAKSSLVFTDKDAAGNKPYDLDVPLALTSNVALVSCKSSLATVPCSNGLPVEIAMIDGKGTVTFYNPLVPGNVTISGLAAGLIAISTSFNVTNSVVTSAIDAAADAAAEAIDAANAATDAANLAAEAADAATVAAEEARDAADAATAAIEELATQVAALIAALQAQIKTLANTVAKIAKKVKA